MFKRIPFNNTYLLIAATVLLLLMSYQLAFKHTLSAWQVNSDLKARLAASIQPAFEPGYLVRKSKNLAKIMELYKVDTSSLRNNFINEVSLLADRHNVKLSGVPVQNVTDAADHFIIEKLEFDGDFFSLLKLSEAMEQQNGIGMLRSETLRLTEVRNGNDKLKKIILEVYLEVSK